MRRSNVNPTGSVTFTVTRGPRPNRSRRALTWFLQLLHR